MMLIKLSQMLSTQLLQEIPIHVPCGWILPKFEETSEESPAWKSSWRRMEIKVCCFHWNWNRAPLGIFWLECFESMITFLAFADKAADAHGHTAGWSKIASLQVSWSPSSSSATSPPPHLLSLLACSSVGILSFCSLAVFCSLAFFCYLVFSAPWQYGNIFEDSSPV